MSTIEIKRDWTEVNRPAIARYLTSRFYGRWPRIIVLGVAMLAVLTGILAAELLLPRQYVPPNWLVAFAPLSLAVFVGSWLNTRWRNKLYRALNAAPIRRDNPGVRLSEHGISEPGLSSAAVLPWRFVTEVLGYKDMVLLLVSPTEYIVLPDSGLPDGLSRSALLQQIARWRAPEP